jgi:hypothetical protein
VGPLRALKKTGLPAMPSDRHGSAFVQSMLPHTAFVFVEGGSPFGFNVGACQLQDSPKPVTLRAFKAHRFRITGTESAL